MPELPQSLVCVHSLGDVASSVPQDTSFGGFVGPGVVQERSYCVPAVVGGMTSGVDGLHDLSPQITVSAIAVWFSGWISDEVGTRRLEPFSDDALDPVMNWYGPDSGYSF